MDQIISCHTFTIGLKMDNITDYDVRQKLNKLLLKQPIESQHKGSYEEHGNRYDLFYEIRKPKIFNHPGIGIEYMRFYEKCGKKCHTRRSMLYLTINPRRILRQELPYVKIFDISDIEELYSELNYIIKEFSENLYLDDCVFSRFDYCVNINFPDQESADSYINLIKQGKVPKGFSMKYMWDMKNRRWITRNNSFAVRCRSFGFSVYNKKRQMEDEEFDFPDTKEADGIVRFECQAYYPKLYYTKRNKGIRDFKGMLENSPINGEEIFRKYIPKMFCTGKYMRYELACSKIDESECSPDIKKRMKFLLLRTSKLKSLEKAINELEEIYTENQIQYIIKEFDNINVNPVTIPNKSKCNSMSNPMELLFSNCPCK